VSPWSGRNLAKCFPNNTKKSKEWVFQFFHTLRNLRLGPKGSCEKLKTTFLYFVFDFFEEK
jgi:hypothetical protein